MRQFRNHDKQKELEDQTLFIRNQSWCTIADVKITFPEDLEVDTKAIREVLVKNPGEGKK